MEAAPKDEGLWNSFNVDDFLNLSVNFLHFQDHKLNICTFLERFSIWTPGFVLVRLVVGHPSNKTVQ